MNDRELAEEIVRRLNSLLDSHPEARGFLTAYAQTKIPAPTRLAVEHPTIQATDGDFRVGFVGVLNGLIGCIEANGQGHVVAGYDRKTGQLLRFILTELPEDA